MPVSAVRPTKAERAAVLIIFNISFSLRFSDPFAEAMDGKIACRS
jgi:hypothetical protein